ncbi:MAG: leucine-rich repeat protein [Clostridia bacterium]|nr:leucine-rich repeat protein [Clostridia bacterium]
MTKRWKRIICTALSLMMTGSLAAEGLVRKQAVGEAPSAAVSQLAKNGSIDFTNVTGQFDTTKITTANFNSSVMENVDAGSTQKHGEHTLIVSLNGDGLVSKAGGQDVDAYLHTKKGAEAAENIKARQDQFLAALEGKNIPYTLVDRYSAVDNAVAIRVNTRYVSKIKDMSGVRSAVLSQTYSRPESVVSYAATEGGVATNETTVYKTGIYDSSEFAGRYAGEGMVVAILDTGLDYTHEAYQTPPSDLTKLGLPLDDSYGTPSDTQSLTSLFAEKSLRAEERTKLSGGNLTAKDVYVSDKVPFAYDYADDDADVYPSYSNHGTHVAGIIGGSADSYTNKDGEIATDENGNVLPFIGVAPEAQLVICKVFTDDLDSKDLGGAISEDILAALEDCVMLGVDIINMSLGTTAGFTWTNDGDDEGEYLSRVYESIQDAGISLMAAASNDYSAGYGGTFGTNKASNPDSGVIGSPSTYPAALSVASISGQKSEYLVANQGTENEKAVFYYESSDENSVLYDFLDQVLGKPGTDGAVANKTLEYVVVPNFGTAADYTAIKSLFSSKPGQRYALVSRGDNTFQEKVDIAAEMGAAGIIVYNNVAGMIRMNLGEVKRVIPAISINLEAGRSMRNAAGTSRVGTFTLDRENLAGPFMSDFSSWGATPDLRLKPEITAHGGEITSTVPGGYDEQSGTSMATPNMAGFMALARSYVEREMNAEIQRVMAMGEGCSRAQAVTRLVNQLTMSTAVTARDQKSLPYSPRKQGAGLASLTNVIGGTSAYLWTSDEFNNYRPKIELYDTHFTDEKVSFALNFNLTNFGDKALSFTTETIAMTETLALDGFAVAEEAYILEKCQESAVWKVAGEKVVDGTISVGVGETKSIEVVITLDESEKDYIENTFKNGMYVEGFLRLNSTTAGQCALAIPYMGFYGDWAAAPMLDYSVFEIDAAEQDTSIDDADKPQASVYETQPFTSYYNDKYILPMGGYMYLLPDGAEEMYADVDKCSVSRYNEYFGEAGTDASENNYLTSTRIQAVYAGLLRNAKYVNYQLVDEYTGEIIHTDVINRVGKAYNSGRASGVPGNVKLELYPEDYNLAANGKYRMDFEFFLDYGDGSANENKFSFTFYVDYEAPQLEQARIRYQNYKQNNVEKQKIYLDLDVYDNHYPQSIMLCYRTTDGVMEDGVTPRTVLNLATEYITPVRDAVRAGKTTVSLEITDIYEKYGDKLYVQVDDYSLNNSLYYLDLQKANSAVLPDDFSLVLDNRLTATEDRMAQAELTLSVYEAYKVKLAYEGNANLSNFVWNSVSSSIVGVKNGEIVGLKAGTSYVKVSNGAHKNMMIKVTVTDAVKKLPTPSISFGTVEETRYKAVLKAKGLLEVFAGKEFQLTVDVEPWYYPMRGTSMVWESKNPDYATVDENGNVKTLKEGLATILGYLYDANGKKLATTSVLLNIEEEFLVSNFTLTEYNGVGYNEVIKDENGNDIKALVLPTDMNIMYIGEDAFKDDTSVEYVVIPETVVQIQQNAFEGCKNLKKVYFVSAQKNEIATSKLTLIHDQAFLNCTLLERLDLSNVKKITVARQTFMNCTSLKTVAKMTAIGTMHSEAFLGCTALEEVDLTGMHMAGSAVFYGCTSLKTVHTAKFTDIGERMFMGCSALQSIEINTPNVGEYAFSNCRNLTSVTFASPEGEALKFMIGDGAFNGCRSLSSVSFGGETVRSIGDGAFANTALTSFTIPAGLESLGGAVLEGSGVAQIVIGDGFDIAAVELSGAPFAGKQITLAAGTQKYKIENGALYSADGKQLLLATDAKDAFVVPEGVESIGEYAFAESAITSVSLPATLKELGEGAFMGSSLSAVEFADGIELSEIKAYTFRESQIANVALPASVQIVGDYAFSSTPITGFAFTGKALGDGVFAYCRALDSIELCDGIEKMGSNTFYQCQSLKTVRMPSVKELGTYTFNGATNLESVIFGENATTIGTATFATYSFDYETYTNKYVEVPKLKTVVMPLAISEIPMNTFYWCTGLTSIDLGGATHLGEYAFANCTSLREVNGIEKVVSTDKYAFYGCSALTSLSLNALERAGEWSFALENTTAGYTELSIPSIQVIEGYAFLGNKASEIALSASLTKIGDGAFAAATSLTAFTVEGNRYFVEKGGLYRYITDTTYELVCYPAGRSGASENRTLSIKEGTLRVQAYAVSFLKDGVLQKVVLPYSVAAIGDGAFYRSGITEYTFESVNAPALEYSYDQTVVDYLTENMVQNRTRSYFNVNFETCVLDYSQYGEKAGKSPLIAKFPVNGVGYDNFLYKTYFGTRETTVIVMTEKTRTATELIDGFPTADEIMAWAENINDENKAKVEALASDAKTARAYANTALSDEAQAEYLGAERVTKLESVETALRAAKKAYGIEVKIARLSYDKNAPFKQEYLVGETFDMSGLVITVEYDDGSKETADLSKMTLVTNRPLTALDQVVTLSGYGRTINILVSVKENAPGGGEDNSSSSGEVSEEKGGCKSSIASFAAVCALGAVGVMMARKRKENRE